MSKKQKKNKKDLAVYNEAVKAIIADCAAHPGLMTEIGIQFARLTGRDLTKQVFHQWLNPDAKKRVEPKYGSAVMLLAAANAASKEFAK